MKKIYHQYFKLKYINKSVENSYLNFHKITRTNSLLLRKASKSRTSIGAGAGVEPLLKIFLELEPEWSRV